MNIVISNAYCFMNKGDAGIIRAMVQEFRKDYPKARIQVVSLFPELDQGKYGDCEVIGPIIQPYQGKSRLMKTFRNTSLYLLVWLMNLLGIPFNRTVREFKKADIIVSCGGGYLKARNLAQFLGDFMYHYIQFLTALQWKKKYVIYAQTVGEFGSHPYVVNRLRRIIQKAELVLPREPISHKFLKSFVPDAGNYFETSDVAFLLNPKEVASASLREQLSGDFLKVGVTMRTWHFPGSADRVGLLRGYKEAMSGAIRRLTEVYGAEVYLMPQCIGPGEDNDLLISREVYEEFRGNDRVKLIEDNLSPEELKFVYSRMSLFVGTRMHSNIFALSESVPCVAVSYDLKTDGIMRAVGLSDYVLDIKGIDEVALTDKIDTALTQLDEMKRILKRNLPGIFSKARLNNELLYTLLDSKETRKASRMGELLDA